MKEPVDGLSVNGISLAISWLPFVLSSSKDSEIFIPLK